MPLHQLNSENTIELARSLSDLQIDMIRSKPDLGDGLIADRLTLLRDAVWPAPGTAHTSHVDMETTFKRALEGLDPAQKTNLLEAYAHMGHLYDMSALTARENFFAHHGIAGGVGEYAARQPDAQTAVEKLNQPVFEVVMTQHPTNINSRTSMKSQRALAKAIGEAIKSGDESGVIAALEHFQRTPLLHERDGKQTNFSVRDETKIVLNFLENIYNDLPQVYGRYDDALKEKFGAAYDPAALNLQMRFGSWGSAGDKDGNNSVTAETTLEAIALHTQAISRLYLDDIKKIDAPELQRWQKLLEAQMSALNDGVLPGIEALRKNAAGVREGTINITATKLNEDFNKLSDQLAGLRHTFNLKAFEKDLGDWYDKHKGEKKAADVLSLLRRVRIFGAGFSKIEYRETAEEYSRVAALLLPGYETLPATARVEKLTELLSGDPAQLREMMHAAEEKIIERGATKAYDAKDAYPIAYHTLKRMQLARDFSDTIKDNVLAECGRTGDHASDQEMCAQGAANMLEALLMQRMAESKDGRKPLLGVVPLFEEPDTMKNIDGILRQVYDNPAYQQHLAAIAKHRPDGEKTQQVQIAHSDNARRAGLQAARAFIHEAHKKVRKLNTEKGIKTEFFEGGSISDAYRNGVRAISASVNAFDLHDFAKFTFQGGDLLNYFNLPTSIERVFTRNIVHPAERFEKKNGKWGVNHRHSRHEEMDDIAIAALKRTLGDYQSKDFTTDTMGILLSVLDYEGETKAGTKGSRVGQRGPAPSFAKVSDVTGINLQPVPIDKVRTIGFSEAWQQAGIVPSWIGSDKLEEYLADEIRKASHGEGTKLSAKDISFLYAQSPAFRDAQDRAAFALAITAPHAIRDVKERLDILTEGGVRDKGRSYLKRILDTYEHAGELAYAALTKKPLSSKLAAKQQKKKNLPVQEGMIEALPRLSSDIRCKTSYRDFLLYAKEDMNRQQDGTMGAEERAEYRQHLRDIIHNAGDTVIHGRYLCADDPVYGDRRIQQAKQAEARSV